MNWLNLNIQTLDSENFLGSEPIDRATWLCLLRYCIGQENGGIIEECLQWGDRKWQQLVRITKKEATRKCDLWEWDGDTLIVWGYPNDKEHEIKHLRSIGKQTSEAKKAAAKANGAKGGRPTINPTENPTETQQETQTKPIERKGKEVEGKEKEKGRGTREALMLYALEIGLPESDGESMFDHWEANGWRNGSSPSKDWKAGMRKWKANGWMPSQKTNGYKPPHKGIQEPELITKGF